MARTRNGLARWHSNTRPYRRSSPLVRRLRLEPLEDRRMLAVFVVENTFDSGAGSLRQAILDANDNPEADEIVFNASVFSTPQTILIDSQLPTITRDVTITGPGRELLTIDAGHGLDGIAGTGDGWRIFEVDNDDIGHFLNVAITGITLTGGDVMGSVANTSGNGGAVRNLENLILADAAIVNNAGVGIFSFGGGVYSSDGTLSIIGSILSGNSARGGGSVFSENGTVDIVASTVQHSSAGFGGGVFNGPGSMSVVDSNFMENTAGSGGAVFHSSGNLIVTGSSVSGNHASTSGGGLYSVFASALIEDTILSANTADFRGAGIYNHSGDLAVAQSTLEYNSANFLGGAVFHSGGLLAVGNSTLSGNSASSGGGVASVAGTVVVSDSTFHENAANYFGGAIHSESDAEATITRSTISGNTAQRGGGIHVFSGSMEILRSTITSNTAHGDGGGIWIRTSTYVSSAIISGNASPDGNDVYFVGSSNPIQSLGYNLVGTGNAVAAFNAQGDQVGVTDPMLGPLTDNGGPTMTHALLPGSPAINAGDPSVAFDPDEFDQRGEPFYRVSGGRIDIGSYEVQGITDPLADFNGDGIVDGFDFLAWQRGFGMSSGAAHADGDANGDEAVDGEDLAIWEQEFGSGGIPVVTTSLAESSFQSIHLKSDEIASPMLDQEPQAKPFWIQLPSEGVSDSEAEWSDSPIEKESVREQAFTMLADTKLQELETGFEWHTAEKTFKPSEVDFDWYEFCSDRIHAVV